jgi:SulP family sulfate permease
VKDAVEARGRVFIVSPENQTKQLLEGFDVFNLMPRDHVVSDRTEALRRAVDNLPPAAETDTQVSAESTPLGALA